jgi:hypothetical protein
MASASRQLKKYNNTSNPCDIDNGDYVKSEDEKCRKNFYEKNKHCCGISYGQDYSPPYSSKGQPRISEAFKKYEYKGIKEKRDKIYIIKSNKRELYLLKRTLDNQLLEIQDDCNERIFLKENELLQNEKETQKLDNEIEKLETEISEIKKLQTEKAEEHKREIQAMRRPRTPRTPRTNNIPPPPPINHVFAVPSLPANHKKSKTTTTTLPHTEVSNPQHNISIIDPDFSTVDSSWSPSFITPPREEREVNATPTRRDLVVDPTPPKKRRRSITKSSENQSPSPSPSPILRQRSTMNLNSHFIIRETPFNSNLRSRSPDKIYETPPQSRRLRSHSTNNNNNNNNNNYINPHSKKKTKKKN